MKSRTTLILVVLAAVVGLVVVWDQYKGTSTEQAREQGKRVLNFKSEDVTRLELAYTNRTVVLEKSGDKWNLRQPLSARADAATVSSILSDLEFAQRDRTLSGEDLKGVDLSEYGLDRPQIRVTMQYKQGPITLLVGRETPTRDAVYVQLQGRKEIAITPKSLLDRLNTSVDSLRSHVAVEFTPSAVARLELKSADRVIELAKTASTTNAEPRWTIVRPLAARADQRKISELLADLGELQIQSFVSEDAKDVHTYQLEEPQREVTVSAGDVGKTLLIGHAPTNDPNNVYAKLKSSDSIFTVAAEPTRKFAVQINELRDPRVLSFSQSNVAGIDVLQGTTKISLERGAKGWKVSAPVPMAADESGVDRILTGLGDLTVAQFVDVAVDLDKYGLAAPTAMVALREQSTNLIAQLLVGGLDGSHTMRYVKRGDEPFIYGVESNAFDWLPANALAVRDRRLSDLQPEQIKKLTIQKRSGPAIVERDAQNKWRLVEPAQGVLDNDALQRLLDAFAQLRAEKFLREGLENLAEYGLEAPELTVIAQAGDKAYTLALGKPAEEGLQYALWSDPPLVFKATTADLAPMLHVIVTRTNAVAASALTNLPPVTTIMPLQPAVPLTSAPPSSIPNP
jgi:hypothetical protein